MEVVVDLSAVAEQNCAPVSLYRIVAAESGWLRSLQVARGASYREGAVLGIVSATADGALDGVPCRPLRVSVCGIVRLTGSLESAG